MSSARFRRLMNDAYIAEDKTAAIDAFNEFHVSHCIAPKRIQIRDSHTQECRFIDVPCGCCYHCMESKINEWCTRMYAHAEDFKHVYFVTLTYRSITDGSLPVNRLMLDKLTDAVWHKDALNETKHYSYSPCLLVKKHYQDFLKRLRKNTGLTDITYVLSGEYGTKYGRPHFHMILFTNGVLTKPDIVRAWSVHLWKSDKVDDEDVNRGWTYRNNQKHHGTAYDFPIGRVDFDDLVASGDFNTAVKIKIDGRYMNAANCFAYVCKYVVKRDTANLDRVRLAYKSLYHNETYTKCFDDEVQFSIVKDWLLAHGYKHDAIAPITQKLKLLSYEKTIFQPNARVYEHGLCRTRHYKVQNYEYDKEFYPSVYYEFRTAFSPFCEFSRAVPIGSVYAKRNISEFAQGVFTRPLLQIKGYVTPAYFRRKASEYLYGLRQLRKTFSGNSFVHSGLIDLQGHLQKSLETNVPPFYSVSHQSREHSFDKIVQDSFRPFADLYTGERIAFSCGYARHYKYDRHSREYVNTRNVPLADFIRYWSKSLQDEFQRYADSSARAKASARDYDATLCMMTDLGLDDKTLRVQFIERTNEERKQLRLLYDEVHRTAE